MSPSSRPLPPSPQQIVADVDAASQRPVPMRCDVCGAKIDGEPSGKGLLIWSRGEERRTEEPVLCETCAAAISAAGGAPWTDDEV